MLVNCPKCGFSQPQDRYCASCGIDMNLFRPLQVPVWKKIISNPLLHVSLIFVLVLASVLFIRQHRNEELRARVEYLNNGPVVVERQQASSLKVSGPTESASTAPTPPAATAATQALPVPANTKATALAPPPPPGNAQPAPASESAAPPIAGALSRSAKTNDYKGKKFYAIYAEVDTRLLNSWVEEMRSTGQLRVFDDAFMGALPQISQKLKSSQSIKILSRIEHTLSPGVLSLEWFVGAHRGEPENEIGFFSSLALSDTKDGLIHGDFEVQRAFREPQGGAGKPVERVSFGSPFELPPGAGYMMRGILPKRFSAIELDEESNPDPALSILKSRSFSAGETEFAFFLEFEASK